MRKKLAVLMGVVIITLLIFTGCEKLDGDGMVNTQAENETSEVSDYGVRIFSIEDWEFSVTKDEVLYDTDYQCDNLVVYVTITNKGSEIGNLEVVSNVIGYQNGENLDYCQLKDETGEALINYNEGIKELEPSASLDVIYGWQLEDDSTVTVSFGGYTVDVERMDLTFDIKDRITDDWKAVQKAAEEELEEKKRVSGYDITGVKGEVPEGWFIDASSDTSVKMKREEGAPQPSLEVSYSKSAESAKAWAEKQSKNYQDAKSIEEKEINGTTYTLLTINETQFMLFADSSEEVTIRIFGMFIGVEDAITVIESLTVK